MGVRMPVLPEAGAVCFGRSGTQFVAVYSGTHLDVYSASEAKHADAGAGDAALPAAQRTACVSTGAAGHDIACACVHSTLDIIFTRGRDGTVRAWTYKSDQGGMLLLGMPVSRTAAARRRGRSL